MQWVSCINKQTYGYIYTLCIKTCVVKMLSSNKSNEQKEHSERYMNSSSDETKRRPIVARY